MLAFYVLYYEVELIFFIHTTGIQIQFEMISYNI